MKSKAELLAMLGEVGDLKRPTHQHKLRRLLRHLIDAEGTAAAEAADLQAQQEKTAAAAAQREVLQQAALNAEGETGLPPNQQQAEQQVPQVSAPDLSGLA